MGEYVGINSWETMTHLRILFASCLLLSKSEVQDGCCPGQGSEDHRPVGVVRSNKFWMTNDGEWLDGLVDQARAAPKQALPLLPRINVELSKM